MAAGYRQSSRPCLLAGVLFYLDQPPIPSGLTLVIVEFEFDLLDSWVCHGSGRRGLFADRGQ